MLHASNFILIATLFLFHSGLCNEAQQRLDPHTDHNKEHLKEDLDGVIGKSPDQMTPDELQFHYFHQHDYDGDNALDGNEIVMSIIHHTKTTGDGSFPPQSDEQLSAIVDEVLKHQDKNDDGKVTFQEYISPYNQQAESSPSPNQ